MQPKQKIPPGALLYLFQLKGKGEPLGCLSREQVTKPWHSLSVCVCVRATSMAVVTALPLFTY